MPQPAPKHYMKERRRLTTIASPDTNLFYLIAPACPVPACKCRLDAPPPRLEREAGMLERPRRAEERGL